MPRSLPKPSEDGLAPIAGQHLRSNLPSSLKQMDGTALVVGAGMDIGFLVCSYTP